MIDKRERVMVLSRAGDLITEARLLNSFRAKFFGFAFQELQSITEPVILFPCRSIHTFFMRFSIDAFFVSAGGQVVKIIRDLPPGKVVFPVRGAKLVLETPADTIYLPDITSVFIPHLIENSP